MDKKLFFFHGLVNYWLNADTIILRNTILLALANTKYKPERETHLTASTSSIKLNFHINLSEITYDIANIATLFL
jgi:ABC-type uncharacterized transport system permease subunit